MGVAMDYLEILERLGCDVDLKGREGGFRTNVYNAIRDYENAFVGSEDLRNVYDSIGIIVEADCYVASSLYSHGKFYEARTFLANVLFPPRCVEMGFKEFLARLNILLDLGFSQAISV